jgi:hypothetical protein
LASNIPTTVPTRLVAINGFYPTLQDKKNPESFAECGAKILNRTLPDYLNGGDAGT